MKSQDEAYLNIRSKLCNAYLIALLILIFPALAASLLRIDTIGWQPVMGLHIVMAVATTLIALFRKSIPYSARVGYIIFFFSIIGLAGVWNFGLAAGSTSLLLAAPILAAIFVNIPAGILVLVLALSGAGAIGATFVLGIHGPMIDTNTYGQTTSAWIVFALGYLLTSGAIVMVIGIFNRSLLETLQTSRTRAQALEASELQHRRLINNLPQIVFSWSSTAGTLYNSPRVEQILGYSPEHLLKHPHLWNERIHPDDRPLVDEAVAGLRNGKPCDLTYRILDAAGEWHWVHDDTIDIRVENGEFVADGIITDITAEHIAEEQLRQAQKMEAIGQLTGGIAHDFNNLLAIMMLNSEYLEDAIDGNEEARPRLEMLKQAIDRASSLTSRLTAYSRRQVLSPAPTDIAALLSGLNDLLQRTLGEMVELTVSRPPDLWPATIDRHQLENALINLAINARDAMPTGGILTISATNVSLNEALPGYIDEIIPGDYVLISVGDTGTGMSPEIKARMFEPFFTTKDVGEGSGLGMSMVFGFVAQSKGYVTVDSEVDKGTTVKVFIPRSLETLPEKSSQGDLLKSPRSGTERILVVEDDADVRAVPVLVLKRQGYHVVEAEDANKALECLRNGQPFDLLFTDIVMPGGMSGLQLAKEARKIHPGLAVLYTSGYTGEAFGTEGSANFGNSILKKPYQRTELLERVRAILDQ